MTPSHLHLPYPLTAPWRLGVMLMFLRSNLLYQRRQTTILLLPFHLPPYPVVMLGTVARQECRPINARSSASRKTAAAAAAAAATLRTNTRCHTSIHHLISIQNTPPYAIARRKAAAVAAAALRTNTRCQTSIHHLISIHHTPPYAIPTATSRLVGQAYTIHRSAFSDGAAKPAPFGSWHNS